MLQKAGVMSLIHKDIVRKNSTECSIWNCYFRATIAEISVHEKLLVDYIRGR